MIETILDRHIIFVLLGILTFIGIMSKCIVNVALKRLVRAAGNMNKSNHPLMRLVRAKFEHASMVSDKVENVRVFVDKYLYEYKVMGMRLHGWRRLEKMAAGLCLLAGAAGAGLAYSVNGMDNLVWRIGATGAGLAVFVFLVHLLTDERYQMEAIRNYMVDYLENVCLHKYEKSNTKEIKVLTQEGLSPEFGVMPAVSGHDDMERNPGRKTESGEKNINRGADAGERELSRDAYALRNREAVREPSAVNIFHSAELSEEAMDVFRVAEPVRDEAVEAFRMAEPVRDEAAEALRAAEPAREEDTGPFRAAKATWENGAVKAAKGGTEALRAAELIREEANSVALELERPVNRESIKENIVEIPVPEAVRELVEPVNIESPEPSKVSIKAASSRQVTARERGQRREKAESEPDRDIVIRRILEEFMA